MLQLHVRQGGSRHQTPPNISTTRRLGTMRAHGIPLAVQYAGRLASSTSSAANTGVCPLLSVLWLPPRIYRRAMVSTSILGPSARWQVLPGPRKCIAVALDKYRLCTFARDLPASLSIKLTSRPDLLLLLGLSAQKNGSMTTIVAGSTRPTRKPCRISQSFQSQQTYECGHFRYTVTRSIIPSADVIDQVPELRNCLDNPQSWRSSFEVRCVSVSCPQSRSADIADWKNLGWILKATGICKQKPELSLELLKALSEDCLCFEGALHQKPMLSIYEEVQSRVGKSGWNTRMVDIFFRTTSPYHRRQSHQAKSNENSRLEISPGPWKISFHQVRPGSQQSLMIDLTFAFVETASTESLLKPLNDVHEPHIRNSIPRLASGSYSTVPNFSSNRKDPQLRCVIIPYNQNLKFSGREKELEKMAKVLNHRMTDPANLGNAHLPSFAISGLGGIGKTQLAVEFVYRHESSFDAVFWVQADGEESLYQSYGQIAIVLGLIDADSVEAKDKHFTRDVVLAWLARPVKQYKQEEEPVEKARWLLIFDGVDDPELLDNFWPRGSSGSVLVTSREPLAELQFYSTESGLTLNPFDIEDTKKYLLRITGRGNDEDEKIMSKLSRRSLADLIRRLRKSKMPGYQHTIASVWGLENLKHSAYLLHVLSFFDPIGIPEYILTSHYVNTDMEGFPQSETEYEEARAQLLQSSLIVRDRSSKKLVIHSLTQDTARANMSDKRNSIVFESALQLLSNVWPYEEEFGFMNETDRWAQCKELYKHMLHLQKLSARLTPPIKLTKQHLQPPKVLLEAAW
nr:hypothetical protein CFP56_00425 [Quercus suber]